MTSAAKELGLELHAEARAPLSVLVSRQIRAAIVSGKIASGDELPSEKELTRDLGVGRSTVREALRILQAQGLLSGGDTVSTRRPRISSEAVLSRAAAFTLENMIRLGAIPLADLVAVRTLLEGAAVARAAEVGREALEPAREALAEMCQASADVERFRAADLAFHRALLRASGNAAFPLLLDALRAAILAHLGEALLRDADPPRAMARLTREHATLLRAVESGDGARARQLVTRHIETFYTQARR